MIGKIVICASISFSLITPAHSQANSSSANYAMESLKIEASDIGEKKACYLKIYTNSKSQEFIQNYGRSYEYALIAFSNRTDEYIRKYSSEKNGGLAMFRFHTWYNLSSFVDHEFNVINSKVDSEAIAHCNALAASSIAQWKDEIRH